MRRVAASQRRTSGVWVFALLAGAAGLPVVTHASMLATFDWVPGTQTPENPDSAATVTPSGTLTLELSSFSLTGTSNPPNAGPYYASAADAAAPDIVGLSYTFANGASVSLSELTSMTLATTSPWLTSGLDDAYNVPSGTPAGYYLVSAFSLSGTADGVNFMLANNAGGVPGATYTNGIANADNSFNGSSLLPAITDGGYWELASVTPVPLPPGLPLLLGGLGLVVLVASRNGSARLV